MAGQQFLAAGAGNGDRPPDRRRPKTVTGGAFSPATGSRSTWARPPCWPACASPGMSPIRKAIRADLLDGTQWQTAYTMADSLGDVETLYFAPRQAPLRAAGQPAADLRLGRVLFEMEPLDSTLSARVSGVDATQAAALWQGGAAVAIPVGRQAPMRSRSPCPRPAHCRPAGRVGRWCAWRCPIAGAGQQRSLARLGTGCAGRQPSAKLAGRHCGATGACVPAERGRRCTRAARLPAGPEGGDDAHEAVPDRRQRRSAGCSRRHCRCSRPTGPPSACTPGDEIDL